MGTRLPPRLAQAVRWSGWAVVVWVVVFLRLGTPSFWDPGDEAHYAQATREMLMSGDWLAPHYNGQPFFDKPLFFYFLQLIAFGLIGPSELAARLVPALSTLVLFGASAWCGARLFDRRTATVGVLMLALLPATFALSAYAILDMTFTALLFAGVALVAVAALRHRPRLQYGGYVLVGLAALTKGPLAFALPAVAVLIASAIAPDVRRMAWRLRWGVGLAIVLAIFVPWFAYAWLRFGHAFIEGYLLRENIWLFTRGLGGTRGPQLSYLRVMTIGMLPWTPLLVGRVIDIARGDAWSTEERMLWSWAAGVTAFFAASSFKMDHYLYPAAPALCLLAGHAWTRLRDAASVRPHLGVVAGAALSAIVVAGTGVALLPMRHRVSDDLWMHITIVGVVLIASGVLGLGRLIAGRFRPPALPLHTTIGILITYSVVLVWLLPRFEAAKPVKPLAQWVVNDPQGVDHIGAYRMDRWNTSWRFYVNRPVTELMTPATLVAFFRQPGRNVCLMLQRDVDALRAAGYRVRVEAAAPGLFVTSGRALRRADGSNWQVFVIVSEVSGPPTF